MAVKTSSAQPEKYLRSHGIISRCRLQASRQPSPTGDCLFLKPQKTDTLIFAYCQRDQNIFGKLVEKTKPSLKILCINNRM